MIFTFRNVVKSFYTAGMLMDVLSTFGEATEEVSIEHVNKHSGDVNIHIIVNINIGKSHK